MPSIPLRPCPPSPVRLCFSPSFSHTPCSEPPLSGPISSSLGRLSLAPSRSSPSTDSSPVAADGSRPRRKPLFRHNPPLDPGPGPRPPKALRQASSSPSLAAWVDPSLMSSGLAAPPPSSVLRHAASDEAVSELGRHAAPSLEACSSPIMLALSKTTLACRAQMLSPRPTSPYF